MQSFRGAYYYHELPTELAGPVRAPSQKEDVTPSTLKLAAFQNSRTATRAPRLSSSATDIANRNHTDVEKLPGLFANRIVLRADLSGNPTFRELLRRVRPAVRDAYAHRASRSRSW